MHHSPLLSYPSQLWTSVGFVLSTVVVFNPVLGRKNKFKKNDLKDKLVIEVWWSLIMIPSFESGVSEPGKSKRCRAVKKPKIEKKGHWTVLWCQTVMSVLLKSVGDAWRNTLGPNISTSDERTHSAVLCKAEYENTESIVGLSHVDGRSCCIYI